MMYVINPGDIRFEHYLWFNLEDACRLASEMSKVYKEEIKVYKLVEVAIYKKPWLTDNEDPEF